MDIKQIEQELQSGLNPWFDYEINYVKNQDGPLLIIFNYSPHDDDPPASFALSLINYQQNSFPSKCWMTHKKLIDDKGPSFNEGYKKFSYRDKCYYPFSVNLSGYTPKDVTSIQTIIDGLYSHIKFDS